MPFTIPVSINYQSPLTPIPANWHKEPIEGRSQIGGEIDWATMGGADKTVAMNVGGNAAAPFSKIAAISVDNSQSGADVTFIFPDTGQTIPVPAYQAGTYPVFTSGTQFYVSAPMALSVDKVTFVIHNAMPPNFSIPKTVFQSAAVVSNILLQDGTTQLIPASVTGSISGLSITILESAAVAWNASVGIKDGLNNVLAYGSAASASSNSYTVYEQSNMQLRFSQGLIATVTANGAGAGGAVVINILYRTP